MTMPDLVELEKAWKKEEKKKRTSQIASRAGALHTSPTLPSSHASRGVTSYSGDAHQPPPLQPQLQPPVYRQHRSGHLVYPHPETTATARVEVEGEERFMLSVAERRVRDLEEQLRSAEERCARAEERYGDMLSIQRQNLTENNTLRLQLTQLRSSQVMFSNPTPLLGMQHLNMHDQRMQQPPAPARQSGRLNTAAVAKSSYDAADAEHCADYKHGWFPSPSYAES